jgi:hypothetical protein
MRIMKRGVKIKISEIELKRAPSPNRMRKTPVNMGFLDRA